jgi:hypothetical protein
VSEKVLTSQLKQLEKDGVISRLDHKTIPPRVDYMLSPAGNELIRVMQAMCDWGSKHLGIAQTLPPLASNQYAKTAAIHFNSGILQGRLYKPRRTLRIPLACRKQACLQHNVASSDANSQRSKCKRWFHQVSVKIVGS